MIEQKYSTVMGDKSQAQQHHIAPCHCNAAGWLEEANANPLQRHANRHKDTSDVLAQTMNMRNLPTMRLTNM